MKFAAALMICALFAAATAAPPAQASSRPVRQLAPAPAVDPLSQLLQDSLLIPQAALQAVSRLLTNPGNTIGQSFNYASAKRQQQQQQQPMQML